MWQQIESRFAQQELYLKECQRKDIPDEIRSHLCRLGAVMVSGNVERCVEIVILERLSKRAHPRVIAFVKSHFQRGTNFDCNAIAQLLVRFDTEWYSNFEEYVRNNGAVKEAMSSCYSVRNSIAHGGNASVGTKRLSELLESSRHLIAGVI